MSQTSMLTHGTCIALGYRAALLTGPSGGGKSDLALRFAMQGARPGQRLDPALIADDQVRLRLERGRLIAAAPDALAGRIEVRGIGIVAVPYRAEAELRLVVMLSAPDDVPRLPPDPAPTVDLLGIAVPVLRLAPFECSAPVKLQLALAGFQ